MSRQLYEVVAGPLPTTLTAPFTYGTDTSIMVLDATDIPEAPNIITISDVDDYFITVEYLTKNDTELTDLTFIEGFEEHEFSIGSEVVRAVAKYDFDAIKDAIDGAHSFDIVIEGEVLPKIDNKVTLPPASQGHLGLVKPGNNVTILPDGTINATGGGGGTGDYEDLENKPQINSVELSGDMSSSDLGLADANDLQSHITDVNNPHSVTKDQVGLGEVDNTSDLDKPISTATQSALDGKVDKETGKGLSTNDFTNTYKQKVDDTADDLSVHIEDMENPHEVTKSQVGLGNVDNTSDLNKPVSNATQTALNGKADITHASTHAAGGDDELTPSDIGAAPTSHRSVTDTYGASSNAYYGHSKASSTIPKALGETANTGVELDSFARGDHVHPLPDVASDSADGLMSSEDKSKLDGIEEQAQKNVKPNWNATTGSAQEILNKPDSLSDFINDENFQTDTEVASSISTHNTSNSSHTDIRQSVSAETSRAEGEEQSLQNQIDALASRTDVVDVVGTKAELLAYDTSELLNNDIVKVLVDESQSNAISYYRWVITEGVGAWVYVGSQGPFYTKSEADGYFVPQQRTINGWSLSNNITLNADDVNALPYDTKLSDLEQDSTHKTVTDAQISSWNGKQAALTFDNTPTEDSANPVKSGGVYSSLSGKVDKETGKSLVSDTKVLGYDSHVADTTIHVTSSDKTAWDGKQDALTFDNTPTSGSANPVKSGGVYSALSEKVDKVTGKQLSTNDFSDALKDKLDGIESGAQVNVQADWNATTAAAGAVKNKPELGTASEKDVPVSGDASSSQVVMGDDSRLNDARTPTSHASSGTTYGVSSASNYGHAKASSSTPSKDGTGAVGTDNGLYARADHIHPTQILFGTTEPTASDGEVGDIHILFE